MDFFQGDRVRCLGKAEWGTGYVIEDSEHGKVKVRFSDAGDKLLSLQHAKLFKVKPPRPTTGKAGHRDRQLPLGHHYPSSWYQPGQPPPSPPG